MKVDAPRPATDNGCVPVRWRDCNGRDLHPLGAAPTMTSPLPNTFKNILPKAGHILVRSLLALLIFFNVSTLLQQELLQAATTPEQPNILWITSEDNNIQWVGCYGNPNADTPRIDKLAEEGFRYTHCFATTPVCAPQRSTWITGVHAVSTGTHPMRSRYEVPHHQIPYYPDMLHKAGYTCFNHNKTDYNIGGRPDGDCWDATPLNAAGDVDFEELKKNQPFFVVINITESHESRAHGSVERTQHDPDHIQLAPYHPDLPDIRKNYAKYQDAVHRMDSLVGNVLDALTAAGLANDTIVIYNSDHGGVLPRSKRFLFDTGIHCPLIVRIPEKFHSLYPAKQPGTTVEEIVSFIDMPKTWLGLAGADIPPTMQGRIFLGPATEPEREYTVAYRGRMDERYDSGRAVRDKRYLYIRNLMPYVPRGQHLAYLWRAPAAGAWEAHHKAGKTDEVTGRFFRNKPTEELYDTWHDPYSVHNLADDPIYEKILVQMRKRLRNWQQEHFDAGLLPETEMVRRAKSNGVTIYEMVRNQELYPLDRLLDASEIALEQSRDNQKTLVTMLADNDSGIRYWAAVGLFLLGEEARNNLPELRKAFDDPDDEVAAMAAWAVYKLGEKEVAREQLRGMLEEDSSAALKVINIIKWMNDDPVYYRDALLSCQSPLQAAYLKRMQQQARQ